MNDTNNTPQNAASGPENTPSDAPRAGAALGFWEAVEAGLDAIKTEKPATFDALRDLMNDYEPTSPYDEGKSPRARHGADAAFFAGSGGDRGLFGVLRAAGWEMTWADADYFWAAKHATTGESLTYVEGDVQRGDSKARA